MSLLEVVSIKTKNNPFMMETPLSESLDGPFLVSSTKGFVWVEKKFPGNFIRSATRKEQPINLFRECVLKIRSLSEERQWGSVKPYSHQGLKDALLYLGYFGFKEFDLYQNPEDKNIDLGFDSLENLFRSWEDWVPKGMLVLTPTDKSYLGTLYSFGKGNFACCVHNPSRGVCILK
tara:strand:+ start:94 stop:621 length:528 start_codon:yes stop_codon:yes gene_type:complete